jgi:hypothetical protein
MAISVRRSFIVIFGICAIAWAIYVIPIYRAEASLASAGQTILSGDRFNAAQLSAMKRQLDGAPVRPVQASATSGATIIRLLLLEDELKASNRQPSESEIADLQKAVGAVLAQSPMDSFMWLTRFTLKRPRGEPEDDLNLLRMSYWSGRNEAWIAIRRNRLALGVFTSLPGDLAEQAQSEFVGLVRSGLYGDASYSLTGPGWPIREQLLSRLAQVPEAERRGFAKALESRDLDDVEVPGVDKRPAHPPAQIGLPHE